MAEQQAKTLEYRFFSLSTAARFIVYALIMVTGLFLQFFLYFPGHSAAGLIIAALGGLLMLGSSYTKVPADLGYEDWKPVTEKEFERVMKNYALVQKAKIPLILKKKEGMVVFIFLSIMSFGILAFIASNTSNITFIILGLDIAVFLYPLYVSGHVTVHAPGELKLKMERFHAITLLSEDLKRKSMSITPYFRFDKDSKGNHIPEDVRLMLEPKGKPEDLAGVQLQVTINNGPNGAVPYMYAVIIFKEQGKSYERIRNASWRIQGKSLLVEQGKEAEFAFLVLRQATENGGYHTTDQNCQALVRQIGDNLSRL